jgi:methyl-accepting chemotaxis protein
MHFITGLSIRLLLGYVLGLLGLMLLILGGAPVLDATASYRNASRLAGVTETSRHLFSAMQTLRYERGRMLIALGAPGPVTPDLRKMAMDSRATVERDYSQGMDGLAKLDDPGLTKLVQAVQLAHQRFDALRPKADAAADVAKENRDPALTAQWIEAADALLAELNCTVDSIDVAIRMHDPAIDALLAAKRASWVMRNAAGDESSLFSKAISTRSPWGVAQIRAAGETRGLQSGMWQVVTEVASRADASPELKAAVAQVNQSYLGKWRELLQPVYDTLQAGGLPDMTIDAYRDKIVSVLDVVGAVCGAALHDMESIAAAREAAALRSLLISAALLFSALVLITIGFVIVQRRVSGPIMRLTAVMARLAGRDFAVEVPSTERRDELGAMARTVQTFRENGLTMLRLETDAAEQRRQVEAERAHAAAQQAERVAQQTAAMDGLADALARLAVGDLTCQLERPFGDDYERIRADFNAAVTGLRETVMSIVAHTATIRTGTHEISTAAGDLALRTERQAAGLEQTAAALQQLTATVRNTAQSGREAQLVASAAQANARQSREVVQQAITAMGAIADSARQISQIIGVIDEIAFQTNLLALNAGVEAARAGESGRGFAVVASEVRALAQRSAEAAKEIKALIQTSSQQVDRGVALVGETGDTLGRMLEQVSHIGQVIEQIAAAAQEQATGLSEVNTAVSEMDQVTQQNAAMVEQTSAATHSLSQETSELSSATARFQINPIQAAAKLPQTRSRAA